MLPIITKIIGSLCLSTSSFFIIRNICNKEEKYFSLYNMLIILVLLLPTTILYKTEYNSIILLSTYILMILLYRRYFKISIDTSILVCSYSLLFMFIADIFITSIWSFFITYQELRTLWYISVINNVLISVLAYLFSKIKILNIKFQNLIKNKTITTVIASILAVSILILLCYNFASIFEFNLYYTITLISMVVILILYYFFISEKGEYDKLSEEFEILFSYVQNFENWIDEEQMYRHELKNSLSIIRDMTKNKKIINKIDDILNVNIAVDQQSIEILKNVPKGGLKGLLYYKIAVANNKRINMVIEVSDNVKNSLKKIKETKLKQLSIILGICIDNAIEETEKMSGKNRNVTIEIYKMNNNINFVISNPSKKIISIKKMYKKGFSTKGKNRGKGLYFISKILKNNKWVKINLKFLNNYFVQKIIVK